MKNKLSKVFFAVFGNNILGKSFVLTFSKLLVVAFSFVISKLMTTFFSLEEYGLFSQSNIITTMATSLTILGMADAVNYFFNKTNKREETDKYIATLFLIQIVIGTICTVVIVACGGLFANSFKNPSLIRVIPIISVVPMFSNIFSMLNVMMVSIGKIKAIALQNIIVSLLKAIIVIISALIIHSIICILIFLTLSEILQSVFFYILLKRNNYGIDLKKATLKYVMPILKFSVPMGLFLLIGTLNREIDKLVISYFGNTELVALYSVAAKMLPFDILAASFSTVLIPHLTRYIGNKEFDKSQHLYSLYLRTSFVITSLLAAGVIPVADKLMLILYDQKYLAGLAVFVVYLFVDIIRFSNLTLVLSASGRSKQLFVYSVIAVLANSIINILFYKLWGMIGPAISTLITTALLGILILSDSNRSVRACKSQVLDDTVYIFRISLILLLCSGVGYLARLLITHLTNNTILVFGCSYGSYFIVACLILLKKIKNLLKQIKEI